MDEVQPMTSARFLELLNKAEHTPEEENDLQAELKRQAAVAQPTESTPETVVPETQPLVDQAASEAQATPAPEATAQPVAEVAQPEAAPYDLTQLKDETETAVAYLETQPSTLAIEEAKSAFTQAAYWTKLASEGK